MSNLKSKLIVLKEKIGKLEMDKKDIDEKYDKVTIFNAGLISKTIIRGQIRCHCKGSQETR